MAPLILHGGQVLTMDDPDTRVSSVAIDDGHVVAVGERETLLRTVGRAAACRDLKGRVGRAS